MLLLTVTLKQACGENNRVVGRFLDFQIGSGIHILVEGDGEGEVLGNVGGVVYREPGGNGRGGNVGNCERTCAIVEGRIGCIGNPEDNRSKLAVYDGVGKRSQSSINGCCVEPVPGRCAIWRRHADTHAGDVGGCPGDGNRLTGAVAFAASGCGNRSGAVFTAQGNLVAFTVPSSAVTVATTTSPSAWAWVAYWPGQRLPC